MDNVMVWTMARTTAQMASDRNAIPTPGDTQKVTATWRTQMDIAYDFEDAATPGKDLFSIEHYYDIMRSYTAGKRGVKFLLCVSANNFESCLANATLRETAATDIAAMANRAAFDGVDLDFEWTYTSAGWNNIALLCQSIRQKLAAGKTLSVSPHSEAYIYPTDKMDCVDFFNFQIYGPNKKTFFEMDRYIQDAEKFVSHGYPKDKIVMSFASTTTGGMNASGTRVANTSAAFYPRGYKDLYQASPIPHSADQTTWSEDSSVYFFLTGFDQSANRTKYCVDNNLGGIMYWDICNDFAPDNENSLVRASSYYINSNVEDLVTEVSSAAALPADDPNGPEATADPEDQGGYDVSPVVLEALELYANYPGYHAAGSAARQALLEAINRAYFGLITDEELTAAMATYRAATAEKIAGPRNGETYYIHGVNSNDNTERYLYADGTALKVTTAKPSELTDAYKWTATALTDSTFTLQNAAGLYIATNSTTLTSDATAARVFPLTAGNALGRLQLVMAEGRYLETRYDIVNDASAIGVVVGGDANCDASNPKRWSSMWMFTPSEPALLSTYTVDAGEGDGTVTIHDVTLGHGEGFYYDPEAGQTFTPAATQWTASTVTPDNTAKTLTLSYGGLSTKKLYRLRNMRTDNEDEYMVFTDEGKLLTAQKNEKSVSQIFALAHVSDSRFSVTGQGVHAGPVSIDARNVQIVVSSTPTPYYVVTRAKDDAVAFDYVKPNGGTYADGSRAISATAQYTTVTTWATGTTYSWWMPEEVTSVELAATMQAPSGNYIAGLTLPFAVSTPAQAFYAVADATSSVSLVEIEGEVIPAATPFLVVSPAETVTLIPAGDAEAVQADAANDLAGNMLGTSASEGAYLLGLDAEGRAAFVKAEAGAAVAANSAWLPAGTGESMPIDSELVTTAIDEISVSERPAEVYDLQGRRVANPRRGIYVQKGKAFILR